ncbi:MAG: twin-arginine translocase TatA/TatE family subunit, partial [Candidatus Omnitrophota bacterium]
MVKIFGIGIQELLLILLICLLIFGAAKLPEIGRALGKTIKEFKKSIKEIGSEDSKDEEKKEP